MAKLARLKHFFEGKRRLSTLDDYHQLKGRSGENRMKLFVSIPLSNGSLDGIPVEIAEEHALMERINSAVTFKKIAVEMKSATFSIFPTDAHKRPIISLPGTTVNGFRLVAQGSDDKRKVNQSSSDILLSYIRAGALYLRQQRDRYAIEYQLSTALTGKRQVQAGLNTILRYQFEITP